MPYSDVMYFEGGYNKVLAICQLSVKFKAICQLSVNWLLIINYVI